MDNKVKQDSILRPSLNVVKIGGNVIDNPDALLPFLRDFTSLPGRKVLVHGGGKEATRLGKSLGIEATMIDGRRVTDRDTLDVVTMVYAGLINKRIVSLLQSLGCNAIGMSGADGNLIKATRRNPKPIDFGYVGDINPDDVNDRLLDTLTSGGWVPVVCAICHDGNATLLNCNADSVAAAVAVGASRFADVQLTYCFEKPGVMLDVDDESSVIPLITRPDFVRLREEGVVAQGMVPKIENALACADQGVKEVRICRASDLKGTQGTTIKI